MSKAIERFLLWVCYIARLADGLVGTVTFTILTPNWSLYAERWYLD